MSSAVRWHRATEMFDGEPAWNAVKERERKDVFEDVTFLLAKKEKEREKELRVENREFMISVFNSMHDVTYRTTWLEVSTVLTRLSAAALFKFPELQMRRSFRGGAL